MRRFCIIYSSGGIFDPLGMCNSIGNSIELVLNLYKYVVRHQISDKILIDYTQPYHKDLLLSVPIFNNKNVKIRRMSRSRNKILKIVSGQKELYETYPQGWSALADNPQVRLKIYKHYKPKIDIHQKSIAIHLRERGTWGNGTNEPWRNVDIHPYHKIALKYARKGYIIVQLGTSRMTKFPKHKNIIHLSHVNGKKLIDDLYAISKCGLLLASDSGIFPAGFAFGVPTILSNCCRHLEGWGKLRPAEVILNKKIAKETNGTILSEEETLKLYANSILKKFIPKEGYHLLDNTFEELDEAVQKMLQNYAD